MRLRASTVQACLTLAGLLAAGAAHAAWPHDPLAGVPIASGTGAQHDVAMVSDGQGGAILAWQDSRSGTYKVYVQRVDASGAILWDPNGKPICSAAGAQTNPQIVTDGEGGAYVVWVDQRNGNSDIYANHVLSWGIIDWPVATGYAVCATGGEQIEPRAISDGANGAIVTWSDARFSPFVYDVYAQRMRQNGAYWGDTGVPVCTATNQQYMPVLAPDGTGGAIVAWWDLRGGVDLDIYAQRIIEWGGLQWPTDGVPVCNAQNDQRDLEMVPDDLGGAVLVWTDERNGFGTSDLYAQRVMASGSRAWAANGVAVCTASGPQFYPKAASDSAGGAIVAWQDLRGVAWDIYAARVTSQGTGPWGTNGIAICSEGGDQQTPDLVADGAGGAIIAWEDRRVGTHYNLYAQRVQGTGIWRWEDNGNLIHGTGSDQLVPRVVVDSASCAIVAWNDGGPGNYEIYAQRVERFGWLGSPEPAITSVLDVHPDQGGQVTVAWNASWTDVEPLEVIQDYRVWRSVPIQGPAARALALRRGITSDPDEAAAKGMLLASPFGAAGYAWELAGSLAADGSPSYQLAVSTTSDSIPGSNPLTAFMVQARKTSGPGYPFWYSAPDSGYSADDLAPATPQDFVGFYQTGSTGLHWDPNGEQDLAGYRLYRGATPDFAPGPGSLVVAQPDTGYTDVTGTTWYYKLTAVDIHGNESPPALVTPPPNGVGGPPPAAALSLAAPAPNPARHAASLRYTLPRAASIRLAVYDLAGRSVRVLHEGPAEAGEHVHDFALADRSGRRLASGVYLIRLESEGVVLTRRIVAIH